MYIYYHMKGWVYIQITGNMVGTITYNFALCVTGKGGYGNYKIHGHIYVIGNIVGWKQHCDEIDQVRGI